MKIILSLVTLFLFGFVLFSSAYADKNPPKNISQIQKN